MPHHWCDFREVSMSQVNFIVSSRIQLLRSRGVMCLRRLVLSFLSTLEQTKSALQATWSVSGAVTQVCIWSINEWSNHACLYEKTTNSFGKQRQLRCYFDWQILCSKKFCAHKIRKRERIRRDVLFAVEDKRWLLISRCLVGNGGLGIFRHFVTATCFMPISTYRYMGWFFCRILSVLQLTYTYKLTVCSINHIGNVQFSDIVLCFHIERPKPRCVHFTAFFVCLLSVLSQNSVT